MMMIDYILQVEKTPEVSYVSLPNSPEVTTPKQTQPDDKNTPEVPHVLLQNLPEGTTPQQSQPDEVQRMMWMEGECSVSYRFTQFSCRFSFFFRLKLCRSD